MNPLDLPDHAPAEPQRQAGTPREAYAGQPRVHGMVRQIRRIIRIAAQPAHLRKTGMIALLVGSWLTAVNLADVLLWQAITPTVLVKVAMNYLTPFVVANLGLLSRQP